MSSTGGGVDIELTAAEDGSVSAEFSDVLAHIKDIETELNRLSSAGKDAGDHITSSTKGMGDAFGEAHGHITTLTGGLKEFADHSLMAARGLDAMGLDANVAAAKVAGLADVLGAAGDAVPALIAAGLAVAAIGVAVVELKASLDVAGQLQQQMDVLGASVRAQGGDWDALGDQVKAFAERQSELTNNTVPEVVSALRQLVASGASVKDAMTIVRVAEDAAAGSGKSLAEVTQGLMEAEHGRTQILSTLGIATRQQIKDGMDFNSILDLVEKNMGGDAAAAAKNYEGSLSGLHNAFENLEDEVGQAFLPLFTAIVKGLHEVVDEIRSDAQPTLNSWGEWFQNHGPEITQRVEDIWHAITDFASEVKDDLGPALNDLFSSIGDVSKSFLKMTGSISDGSASRNDLRTDLSLIVKDIAAMIEGIANLAKAIDDNKQALGFFGWLIAGTKTVGDLSSGNFDSLDGDKAMVERFRKAATGEQDPGVYDGSVDGLQLGQTGSSGFNFGQSFKPTAYVPGPAPATKGKPQKLHVDSNPTVGGSPGKQAPSWTPSAISDSSGGGTKGPDAIVTAQKALEASLKSITEGETSYKNAVELATTSDQKFAAQAALNQKIDDDRQKTIKALNDAIYDETQKGHELSAALAEQKGAHEAAIVALKNYETTLGTAGPKMAGQKLELQDLEKAVKSTGTAVDDTTRKIAENTANLTRNSAALLTNKDAVSAVGKAQSEAELAYNNAIAALHQSLADELATYGRSEAAQLAYWQMQEEIAKAGGDKMLDRLVTVEQNIQSIELGSYKQREDQYTQFVSNLESQEENWIDAFVKGGQSLRDLLRNIWSDILNDFLKMLEEMIVKSTVFKEIESNLGGAFSSLLSGIGGGGVNAATMSTEAQFTVGGDVVQTAAGKATLTQVAGVSPGASSSFFGTAAAPGVGAFLTAAIGGAFIGGGIGAAEGKGTGAESTHAMNGAIGGGIGATAALLLAGPAGWAAIAAMAVGGAILGGITGGMIGPHWGPATNYPDRSDPNYGQFVSNWNGVTGTFNGNTVNPESQYAGKPQDMAAQMVAWAQANPNDPVAKEILGLGNSQADLDISSEKNGVFTLGDGKTISVTDLEQIAAQWEQAKANTPAASTPTFTMTRTYPDFNIAAVYDSNGNLVAGGAPGKTTGPGGTQDTSGGSGSGGTGGGGTPTPRTLPPPPQVNNNFDFSGATFVGPAGLAEVAQTISAAFAQLNNGLLPGGYAASSTGKLRSKFS